MYNFFKSLKLLSLMTILLGFIYPLIVLGIGNLIFPFNSKGSLIEEDNKIRGLINELTNKLLKDNSVNPQVFDIMVNRLYSKHNDKFNTILHDFDFVQINSL